MTATAIFFIQISPMFPVSGEIFFTFLRNIFGQRISDARLAGEAYWHQYRCQKNILQYES